MTTVIVFHTIPRVLFCSVAEAAAGVHEEDEAGAEQGAHNPRFATQAPSRLLRLTRRGAGSGSKVDEGAFVDRDGGEQSF